MQSASERGRPVSHVTIPTTHENRCLPHQEQFPMALTITGLSKTYTNGVRALNNVSLTIGNNMFGLLGPNGAGKSSLMRTIATLQEPDEGSIDLDGLNVLTHKDEGRKT